MPLEIYIGLCKTRETNLNNKAIAEAVGLKFGGAKKVLLLRDIFKLFTSCRRS